MKRAALDKRAFLVTAEHRRPPLGSPWANSGTGGGIKRRRRDRRISTLVRGRGVLLSRFKMQKHVLMLTTSGFILACGDIAASAQQPLGGPMMQQPDQQQTQQQPTDHEGRGMGKEA
jgi:hypothetical protein